MLTGAVGIGSCWAKHTAGAVLRTFASMRDLVVSLEWIACAELAPLCRDGCRREYNIIAAELWRNAWIYQVKVGDKEIKVPALDELDFDSAGDEEVYFVPINAGTYEFRARGLEQRGMVGKIIVE